MFQMIAHLLMPILFAATGPCASDLDSDCHTPGDSWRTATIYVSVDDNPDHDTILIGPDSDVNDMPGRDVVIVEFHNN